jgi:hypothetical protein
LICANRFRFKRRLSERRQLAYAAFRVLNVLDDFTRECVAIDVGRSIPGVRSCVCSSIWACDGYVGQMLIDDLFLPSAS